MINYTFKGVLLSLVFFSILLFFEIGTLWISGVLFVFIQVVLLIFCGIVLRMRFGQKKDFYIIMYLISIMILKIVEYIFKDDFSFMWTFFALFLVDVLMIIPLERLVDSSNVKLINTFFTVIFVVLYISFVGTDMYFYLKELNYLVFIPSALVFGFTCYGMLNIVKVKVIK